MQGVARSGNTKRFWKRLSLIALQQAVPTKTDVRTQQMHNIMLRVRPQLPPESSPAATSFVTVDVYPTVAAGQALRYHLGVVETGAYVLEWHLDYAAERVVVVDAGATAEDELFGLDVMWSDGPYESCTLVAT